MGKSVQKILCIPAFEINDEFDCLGHNKITEHDLLDLCGGIPINEKFPLSCKITSSSRAHVRVEITSSIYICERSFDFNTKTIRNDYLRVPSTGVGTGKKLFITQLLAARRLNFETIRLHAMGGDTGNDWNGFYTWGRFGFTMEDADKISFEISMQDHERGELSLAELLSTQEGRSFWIQKGFGWAGKFDIKPKSENSNLLNDYLIEKGLNPL